MDTTLENVCEEGKTVKGKYIFVNTGSKAPGNPDCLVFNEKNEGEWDYTMFNADSEVVQLDGVKLVNSHMSVEVYGTVAEVIDDALDYGKDQFKNLMNDLHENVTEIPVTNFALPTNKIQIDSSPSRKSQNRILGGQRTPNFLTPPEPKKKEFQDDVKEEGEVMRKRLNSHLMELINKQKQERLEGKQSSSDDQSSKIVNQMIEENDLDSKDVNNEMIEKLRKEFMKKYLDESISTNNLKKNRILTKESNIIDDTVNQLEEKKNNLADKIQNFTENILSDDYKTEVNFYCDTNNPKIMSHYLPTQSLLQINVFSSDGCVINFEFLQLLNEIPWITGAVFLILGIGLAFLGVKVYKNLLIVFIPMMLAILGFYLYFALVENSKTSTTKILTLVGLLVFIFIIAVLMVWFNWLIYLTVAFGVSCQFGLLSQSFLAQSVEFFTKPYTEWILIVLFFVLFTVMYILAKDYFVILSTAIMGSLFFVLSLKYLGITDFDLLFDLQIEKMVDFGALDSEVQKMTIVFIGVLVIGTIVQIVLLRRTKDNEEKEMKMANLHDNQKNVNIQLENI
jgi:hypothetical protein